MNWNATTADDKTLPVQELTRTFQGRKVHPCRRLTWWFHWGDQLFDIRSVRVHIGAPSDVPEDFTRTKAEQLSAVVKELRTLVGRKPFAALLLKLEGVAH